MARHIPEDTLVAIEHAVHPHPDGAAAPEILRSFSADIPLRTLQYRLKYLVSQHRVVMGGKGCWAKYRVSNVVAEPVAYANLEVGHGQLIPLSKAATSICNYVRQAPKARKPVGYNRGFLDQYRPNVSFYFSKRERTHLASIGRQRIPEQPAGTYARLILSRLLIDLAWNSSRLEGNTYSLLDTKRLIEFGQEEEGGEHREAQMILNHKDAIEFLVSSADDISFDNYTILNLHALLANNLLADPAEPGRLRHIAVGIENSAFHPLEVPQLIIECFKQILDTANAISDPFEQAFFVMVQLPYLQPFDDENKRVSRIAADTPLIRNNFSSLSFVDVPRQDYTEAVIGVYELNKTALLKGTFLWAYERSAARYVAVRQLLGEPDPFRLRYSTELRDVIRKFITEGTGRVGATIWITKWTSEHITPKDRAQFVEIVEAELIGLHEGNFARYQVRPSEFASWRKVWEVK